MDRLTFDDTQQLLTTIHNLHTLKNAKTFGEDSLVMLDRILPAEASLAMTFQADFTDIAIQSWQKLSERDRLMLNLLQPHLIQAYQNVCQYQQFQQSIAELQQSLDLCGVVLVDDLGKVQLMTAQVATWLQFYFPSNRHVSQLPELLQSWVKYQIDRLKSVDKPLSPQLPLRFQQENKQLTIRLAIDIPGKRYLLFFAEESILSIFAALELLGLTQREAEILASVIHGRSNQEIATDLRMNINTVRKHLEHMYQKLGVQSRTEAISVALDRLGCLNISLLV
jgi:DNA-binding CsgD family transcriptional regulator